MGPSGPFRKLHSHWVPSSIEETENYKLLSPNPVKELFTINIDRNSVYYEEIINKDVFSYNVEKLASGTYFLLLESNQNIESFKFIKK